MSREAERSLDAYLIAAIKAGDRMAAPRLVKRWHPKMMAHACRLLGERDLAEDAVQEAWAEIIRGLSRLAEPRAFAVWALRIVSRRCARMIGKRQSKRRLDAALTAEPEPAHDSEELSPDQARVRTAIRQLPAAQRAAIALFYLEDMSVAEVAVALDVPAGTVKTRLMHARERLRAILQGERS